MSTHKHTHNTIQAKHKPIPNIDVCILVRTIASLVGIDPLQWGKT